MPESSDGIAPATVQLASGKRVKSIGFRAGPDVVYWAILTGLPDRAEIIAKGHLQLPVASEEAQRLSWLRVRVANVIGDHSPSRASIRFPEPIGPGANRDSARQRCRVEGVLLEVCDSLGVTVETGALKTITARLGMKSAKTELAQDEVRGVALKGLPIETREAILVAIAALR